MPNYRVTCDGECSSISLTKDEADGYSIFSSFREAKRELLEQLDTIVYGIRWKQRELRSLRKEDVEEESEYR